MIGHQRMEVGRERKRAGRFSWLTIRGGFVTSVRLLNARESGGEIADGVCFSAAT